MQICLIDLNCFFFNISLKSSFLHFARLQFSTSGRASQLNHTIHPYTYIITRMYIYIYIRMFVHILACHIDPPKKLPF